MDIDSKIYCDRCMREMAAEGVCPHCGYDPKAAAEPSVLDRGTLLNRRYQLGAVIGQGGFGKTYAAWDEILGMPVAVKEYFPVDFCTRNTELSDDVVPLESRRAAYLDGLRRFQRESRLLAELQGIPNIVKVLDFFEENETAYIAMEYIHGVPLDEWVREKGLDARETLRIVRPVIDALVQTHRQGVLHRDLTPGNMLVCEDGSVKLIDFGSASELERSGGTVVLTRKYAAVEQYGSEHGIQGPWTDVYGIGAVLYALLTGTEPQESVLRVYKDELAPPRKLGIRLKKDQEEALMNALTVDPGRRTQSMEEFRARLYGLPLPQEIIRRKRLMRRLGIAAALLLVLAAVLLANFAGGLPLSQGLLFGLRGDGWHIMGTYGAQAERTLPDSLLGIPVTAVNSGAFREDPVLTRVEVPGSVRSIGDTAFYACPELTGVTLGEGVGTVGVACFAACPNLAEVTLPESLSGIPADAFSGSGEELTIWGPRGSAAERCAAEAGLPFVDGREMDFEPAEGGLRLTRLDSAAEKLVIPSHVGGVPVVEIAKGVRISEAEELDLPKHLQAVPDSLCENNRNLKVLRMGPDVREIGEAAFAGCERLKDFAIPDSVETIGMLAFYHCEALRIMILPKGLQRLDLSWIVGCDSLLVLQIPEGVTWFSEPDGMDFHPRLTMIISRDSWEAEQYCLKYDWRYDYEDENDWLADWKNYLQSI